MEPRMSVPTENPLLKRMQKIIPGTTIRLPSKGIFYKNGELDVDVQGGEIIISPMTTKDELIIRSPDMLFQGTAIEQIVARCAPQVLKPTELFAKDIDYILVMLRKLSYGNDIIINFTCPTCVLKADKNEKVTPHDYPVSIDYFIRKSKEITDLTKYQISLNNGMNVKLRPSKFAEMIKMNQLNDNVTTPDELEEIITTSILAVIEAVDDVDNQDFIKEWLKKIPVLTMKEIVDKIAEANNWGPDFNYKINCKDCETEHDISYILNPVSFFTLPSSQETSKG
jgi:hypothetical protein